MSHAYYTLLTYAKFDVVLVKICSLFSVGANINLSDCKIRIFLWMLDEIRSICLVDVGNLVAFINPWMWQHIQYTEAQLLTSWQITSCNQQTQLCLRQTKVMQFYFVLNFIRTLPKPMCTTTMSYRMYHTPGITTKTFSFRREDIQCWAGGCLLPETWPWSWSDQRQRRRHQQSDH